MEVISASTLLQKRKDTDCQIISLRSSSEAKIKTLEDGDSGARGPRKLLPFLVRKNSPKRTSNPLSFEPQIRNVGQGQHVTFPKKEASREF